MLKGVINANADLKRVLLAACMGGGLAVVVSVVLPADYVARASILVDTSQESIGGGFSQIADLIGGNSLASLVSRENGYTYIEILRSRTILDRLLQRSVPGRGPLTYAEWLGGRGKQALRNEVALKQLNNMTRLEYSTRDHVLYLTVRSSNAAASADIANHLVDALRDYNATTRTSRQREAVVFIEARAREANEALALAENRFAAFQEANARIGNAPNLRLKLRRLERDVAQSEEVYALLAKQLELARIQEKRENPVFSVIDRAAVPAKQERLSKVVALALGCLIGGASTLLIAAAIASGKEELGAEREAA